MQNFSLHYQKVANYPALANSFAKLYIFFSIPILRFDGNRTELVWFFTQLHLNCFKIKRGKIKISAKFGCCDTKSCSEGPLIVFPVFFVGFFSNFS